MFTFKLTLENGKLACFRHAPILAVHSVSN